MDSIGLELAHAAGPVEHTWPYSASMPHLAYVAPSGKIVEMVFPIDTGTSGRKCNRSVSGLHSILPEDELVPSRAAEIRDGGGKDEPPPSFIILHGAKKTHCADVPGCASKK